MLNAKIIFNMRLFIALNFSERFLDALAETTQELQKQTIFARPTQRENFHLTLAFLGEQEDTAGSIAAIDACAASAFTLVTGHCGAFHQRNGDLWWLGLRRQANLLHMQESLRQQLLLQGYHMENRTFKPHLTLLREARMQPDFDLAAFNSSLPPLHERITSIHLMQSVRQAGKLCYLELYKREL